MKITFLGTSSGTEPIAGRHHTSLLVEVDGEAPFFIDAGEGCGYRAHLNGFDLLAVRDIFITHSHMDHIGGLANLLWYQRKLWTLDKNSSIGGKTVTVHICDKHAWEGVWQLLGATESHFARDYEVVANHYEDGIIYNSANLKITALHNHHLKDHKEGEPWLSHSFKLETANNTTVISGDVGDISDLETLLPGADWLCMETGHHKVENIATYLANKFPNTRLCLYHHGRAMLADPIAQAVVGENILKSSVIAAEEGMSLNTNSR